jgi:hypothetical protein
LGLRERTDGTPMTEAKALRVRLRREGTRPVDGSRQRACRDIEFQQALLVEATQMLLDGNLDKGRGRAALLHQRRF